MINQLYELDKSAVFFYLWFPATVNLFLIYPILRISHYICWTIKFQAQNLIKLKSLKSLKVSFFSELSRRTKTSAYFKEKVITVYHITQLLKCFSIIFLSTLKIVANKNIVKPNFLYKHILKMKYYIFINLFFYCNVTFYYK